MQTIGGGHNQGNTPKNTIHDLTHLQVAAITAKGIAHGTPTKKTKKS
jgi:hypothetical protein